MKPYHQKHLSCADKVFWICPGIWKVAISDKTKVSWGAFIPSELILVPFLWVKDFKRKKTDSYLQTCKMAVTCFL